MATGRGRARPQTRRWSLAIWAVLVAVVLGLSAPAASHEEPPGGHGGQPVADTPPNSPDGAGGTEQFLDAPIVIETADDSIDPRHPALLTEMQEIHDEFAPGWSRSVAQPVASWPFAAATNSGFTVTFDATHTAPSNVQAVVLAGAQAWDDALSTTSAGPVQIAVIWRDLGSPNLLGSAGPNGLYTSGSLPTSSFYPVPLVNTLLGTDMNGSSNPELIVNLNSTSNWYIGTSGSPGSGQIDLYSVVLHEIGHGLGFLGSGSTGNDPGPSPTLDSPPFVYDESVTHGGTPLLSTTNANSLLTSNDLSIKLSSSLTGKVYVPGTWQEGSSFSHFDEAAHGAGSPGALMTPSLTVQETERTLDAAVLGVLAQLGWPMRVTAVTPTITSVNPTSSEVAVTWTTDLGQVGLAPDGHRVEAWRGSTLDASVDLPASTGSTTLTGLQPGASYTLKVVPYAKGVDGTAATQGFAADGAPSAPAIVTASGSTLTQTVSWSAAPGGATSYDVERSTDGVTWHAVGSTGALSIAVVVPEGVHQYRVRAHNAWGAGSWGYSIPTGASAGVARPVPLDAQLVRLYQAYFLRDPDQAGYDHWLPTRAGGTSLGQISSVFAASAEFVAAYGHLTDAQFVDLVYQNVLGRPADAGGSAYWVGVLASGVSRGDVMVQLSESAEFIARTGTVAPTTVAEAEVYRLYVAFFLRFPDQSGLDYWAGIRAGGTSLEAIAASFAASAEFQATYGSLPDAQFVELVYNNVLGRAADASGSAYWVGQLAAGLDRGAMMVGFSESAELVITTGTIPS